MKIKFTTFIILFTFFCNQVFAQDYCSSPQKYYEVILNEVAKKKPHCNR